ncbi:MAG: hypothetical protein ACMXYF_03885 [Candidatus Woesearchaeota archaeon]
MITFRFLKRVFGIHIALTLLYFVIAIFAGVYASAQFATLLFIYALFMAMAGFGVLIKNKPSIIASIVLNVVGIIDGFSGIFHLRSTGISDPITYLIALFILALHVAVVIMGIHIWQQFATHTRLSTSPVNQRSEPAIVQKSITKPAVKKKTTKKVVKKAAKKKTTAKKTTKKKTTRAKKR